MTWCLNNSLNNWLFIRLICILIDYSIVVMNEMFYQFYEPNSNLDLDKSLRMLHGLVNIFKKQTAKIKKEIPRLNLLRQQMWNAYRKKLNKIVEKKPLQFLFL